ncbi:hypothetical protein KRP22_002668 [Phytophthora ramorum]|nr:hypothetical protein KRP22_6315 [Phytophthora ramorum]
MMRRIVYQRAFSFRRPTKSVLSTLDLEEEQRKFASEVGSKVSATERGAKKGVKIKGRVRSERESVLLIVSATGQKLRPPIIFKGQPAERVEEEVQGHSNRVMATVQTNAWMDSRVWRDIFIENAWGGFVCDAQPGPLAIYVDNLKCHVSTEAQDAFATWGTEVVPLPKNITSVLQPGHGPV